MRGTELYGLARSLKLWSFYCDLEESLGTLESTRAVYDQILELRIATPQIILNYALFLQVCIRGRDFWLGHDSLLPTKLSFRVMALQACT